MADADNVIEFNWAARQGVDNAHDVEIHYLGACMAIDGVIADSNLTPDDFERPAYGALFQAMRERHAAGKGVTQSLMLEQFPNQFEIILRATDYPGDYLAYSALEEAIVDRAVRRRMTAASIAIGNMAKHSGPVDDVIDVARKTLDDALGRHEVRITSMLDDVHQVLHEYRKAVHVTPSPWEKLNGIIGGFAPGRMYVLAARPGIGKSSLATQIAYRLAQNGAVIFSTLEMTKGEIYTRILAQQANSYYPKSGEAIPDHVILQEAEWIDTSLPDIRVLDDSKQTTATIRAAARAAAREGHLKGIVVDYLQLLTVTSKVDGEVARITELTRELKLMAKDFGVPVIVLSQLNRGITSRADAIPGLQDLRGSGSIEQDADAVIMLYRLNEDDKTSINVNVAKNRNGKAFEGFDLHWEGQFFRASDFRPDPFNDPHAPQPN